MKYRSPLTRTQSDIVQLLKQFNAKRTQGLWEGDGDYVFAGDHSIDFERGDANTVFLALCTTHMDEIISIIEARYVVL